MKARANAGLFAMEATEKFTALQQSDAYLLGQIRLPRLGHKARYAVE
jgi:hypothetical protein